MRTLLEVSFWTGGFMLVIVKETQRLRHEGANDPEEEERRDAHTQLLRTRMRGSTPWPLGLASYTTC